MLKIRALLIPYAIWYLLVMVSSALLDWAIVKKLAEDAERERTFFKRLGVLLVLNGALQFYVVAIARSGPNDFLWVSFILLSLLPIFFVAYHVYRYRIVDVAVRDSQDDTAVNVTLSLGAAYRFPGGTTLSLIGYAANESHLVVVNPSVATAETLPTAPAHLDSERDWTPGALVALTIPFGGS